MSRTFWSPSMMSSDSNDEWKTHPMRVASPPLVSPASPTASSSSYTTSKSNAILASASISSQQRHSLSLTEFADGKFVILDPLEASTLYNCRHKETQRDYVCKVVPTKSYHDYLSGYLRMNGNSGVNNILAVHVGPEFTFVVFPQSHGDLHSYVRSLRKLSEVEAIRLFHQIVKIADDCHQNGICLRDVKLRKFVFSDPDKTQLKLETLDDAIVLSDADDDLLEDRHGCPVYASPEILSSQPSSKYSGRAAGSWSLGVLLYTMLVGRYPFSDANPVSLLNKIRRCQFSIPSSISPTTRLVISSLLQKDPQDRMTTEELLDSKLFSKDFLEDLKEIRQSC